MSLAGSLCGLGLRIFLGDAGEGVQNVLASVRERFEDHSQALPKALTRANDQAWQALAVALAGDGFLDQIKRVVAQGESRGLHERVKGFLGRHAAYFDQSPDTFRRACLAELEKARRDGLLSLKDMTAAEAARQAAFPYYHDQKELLAGAVRAVERLADALATPCPHLARLLRQPTPGGPPLLVSAFAFFFRREIETDDQLARGMTFESLRQLSEDQAAGFAAVGSALDEFGGRFDTVMDQLGRIEFTVLETRDAVLDMRDELRRLGSLRLADIDEVRRLVGETMARVSHEGREAAPAVGDDMEQEMTVRRLVARIRRLPEDQRRQVPTLLLHQWQDKEPTPQPPNGPLVTNTLGMGFAWIPPGSFLRGSPPEERQRRTDETQHGVTLSRGFYLGVQLVTQAAWRSVLGVNPSRFIGDELPVETVSWDDCRAFARRLSHRDGRAYRLPTEAEWEYACRAGTAGAFHRGSTLSAEEANFDSGDAGLFRARTTAVDAFPANAWGLHDLHGNVYEWCADWYGPYPGGHVTDPTGPTEGEVRVLRGGSWFSAAWYCRSAARYWADPSFRDAHVGCRVCFSVE